MTIPDISSLSIHSTERRPDGQIPNVDIADRYTEKLKAYTESLPYSIEPHSRMVEMLDFILLRITQCVEAKDYDTGLLQWDSMLT